MLDFNLELHILQSNALPLGHNIPLEPQYPTSYWSQKGIFEILIFDMFTPTTKQILQHWCHQQETLMNSLFQVLHRRQCHEFLSYQWITKAQLVYLNLGPKRSLFGPWQKFKGCFQVAWLSYMLNIASQSTKKVANKNNVHMFQYKEFGWCTVKKRQNNCQLELLDTLYRTGVSIQYSEETCYPRSIFGVT
jgi:hypothetical protein